MSWAAEFTDRLLDLKRGGMEFQRAWTICLRYLPPNPRRDFGIRGPWFPAGTFHAEAAEQEHLRWFRGVCEAAWLEAPAQDGHPSRLRLLRSDPVLSRLTKPARGMSRKIAA